MNILFSRYSESELNLEVSQPHRSFVLNNINISLKEETELNRPAVDSNLSVLRANISLWTERWFLSSNAKDIGTLYLIFALFSGLLGTAFSVLIRLELSGPGVQYIADNQLYNAIITAHAILMIFFMVEIFRLNFKSQPSLNTEKIGDDNNNILTIGKANNNGGNKNSQEPKRKYVKILVEDPFNNRNLILKVTKKQKGVYSPDKLSPDWVTGFSDGESCFGFRVRKTPN